MKTENEIKIMLKELRADERNYYKTATVFANAPLALIQYGLTSQIHVLEAILDLPLSHFPLVRDNTQVNQ